MYVKNYLNCTIIPYRFNFNNVEITVMVLRQPIPNIHIIGTYHFQTNVTISQLIDALNHLQNSLLMKPEIPDVILGDFIVDLMTANTEQKALKQYLITDRAYTQLINKHATEYRTQIDHIYTNPMYHSMCNLQVPLPRVILQ